MSTDHLKTRLAEFQPQRPSKPSNAEILVRVNQFESFIAQPSGLRWEIVPDLRGILVSRNC